MRDHLRDWRHSLRGNQPRSAKIRTPLDTSSRTRRPSTQVPGPSQGSQQASSRATSRQHGSIRRLLERLGNLSLNNESQQTIRNPPAEDHPMPDVNNIPEPPPVPVLPHAEPVHPIPVPLPFPAPSNNQVPVKNVKTPEAPGAEAAARAVEVASSGFNLAIPTIEWAVPETPKRPVVKKSSSSDWLHQNVGSWGDVDHEEDKPVTGEDTDDVFGGVNNNQDDDDDDDSNTDWGQGKTEKWMENFAPNKFADRDYVDSGEPDDPEVCERSSDDDIMTFELEFLLAVTSAMRKNPGEPHRLDPHPRERRWISRKLESRNIRRHYDDDPDTIYFKRYAARRVVRLLLRNKIPTHEGDMGNYQDDLSESDFTDDETPNWANVVRRFTVNERYNPNRTHYENGSIGFRFVDEFCRFCESNDVDIIKLKTEHVDLVRERVEECLYDWPNNNHRLQVTANFEYKLAQSCEDRKALDKLALSSAEDTLHVPVRGLKSNYKAWSVVEDLSVDGEGMTPNRYLIPMFNQSKRPMRDYYWFGAELVSPPLSFDDNQARESVRRACRTLRGSLRCHKPMEASTGLHVHLGHKIGWNLLMIKRFVTLWALAEPVLIHLHRKDRASAKMARWCGKLVDATCLGQALFHPSLQTRYKQSGYLPRFSPGERTRNRTNMASHYDLATIDPRTREFINNVWQYPTISELTSGLSGGDDEEHDYLRPSIRVRIRGNKLSDPADENNPGTIEVRTMHGTLDADHILEWLAVLRKLLAIARYATNESFKGIVGLITRTLDGTDKMKVHALLLGIQLPPRTVHYFMSDINRVGSTDRDEDYWVYPDLDIVDWVDPFMVPGHRATHGQQYNIGN